MTNEGPLVSSEMRGEVLVVVIHAAQFDSASAHDIQTAIDRAVDESPAAAVAIDLGEVDLLTSAGLGALIHLHTRLRTSNRRLAACGARREVAAVIQVARLDRLLEVCPSVGAFLLRLRRETG